jgi:hypothetical protein
LAERVERRTAIVPVEQICDRHVEEPCNGEKLGSRDPVGTLLKLVYRADG